MKKAPGDDEEHYVTSVRLKRSLAHRAQDLGKKNERARTGKDDSFTAVLNNALAEYLKKKGA